jgi:hypothetical protein
MIDLSQKDEILEIHEMHSRSGIFPTSTDKKL